MPRILSRLRGQSDDRTPLLNSVPESHSCHDKLLSSVGTAAAASCHLRPTMTSGRTRRSSSVTTRVCTVRSVSTADEKAAADSCHSQAVTGNKEHEQQLLLTVKPRRTRPRWAVILAIRMLLYVVVFWCATKIIIRLFRNIFPHLKSHDDSFLNPRSPRAWSSLQPFCELCSDIKTNKSDVYFFRAKNIAGEGTILKWNFPACSIFNYRMRVCVFLRRVLGTPLRIHINNSRLQKS